MVLTRETTTAAREQRCSCGNAFGLSVLTVYVHEHGQPTARRVVAPFCHKCKWNLLGDLPLGETVRADQTAGDLGFDPVALGC